MKRLLSALFAGLCGLVVLSSTPTAAGIAIAIMPAPAQVRVARADVVVVGTVTDIEEKPVKAAAFPGSKEKVDFYVATVKVDEHVIGAKGLTHLKVAYRAPVQPQGGPIDPNDRVRPIRPIRPPIGPGMQPPTLAKGQEACLYLKKHGEETFYVLVNFDDVVDKKAGDFKQMVEASKQAAKVLDDPKASLKSDKQDERFMAASMLMNRYRTAQPGIDPSTVKQEEIDADESKLILKALAEANWNAPIRGGFGTGYTSPQQCFSALNLTEKDGWVFRGGNFNEAAQQWLKANAEKYRVKRFAVKAKK